MTLGGAIDCSVSIQPDVALLKVQEYPWKMKLRTPHAAIREAE
jgi:hypothetical protein